MSATTTLDLRERLKLENDEAAQELRESLRRAGTVALNLISSPGSGKTTLLEATLARLAGERSCAVLVGDVATERDAERLARSGCPVKQISTGGSCHLDARLVRRAWDDLGRPPVDLLFVENVGNLICPTGFDLGENAKVALLSCTEGDDKVLKYPALFRRADAVLVTKRDLIGRAGIRFDLERVRADLELLDGPRPLLVSAFEDGGLEDWIGWLRARLLPRVAARPPLERAGHAARAD